MTSKYPNDYKYRWQITSCAVRLIRQHIGPYSSKIWRLIISSYLFFISLFSFCSFLPTVTFRSHRCQHQPLLTSANNSSRMAELQVLHRGLVTLQVTHSPLPVYCSLVHCAQCSSMRACDKGVGKRSATFQLPYPREPVRGDYQQQRGRRFSTGGKCHV